MLRCTVKPARGSRDAADRPARRRFQRERTGIERRLAELRHHRESVHHVEDAAQRRHRGLGNRHETHMERLRSGLGACGGISGPFEKRTDLAPQRRRATFPFRRRRTRRWRKRPDSGQPGSAGRSGLSATSRAASGSSERQQETCEHAEPQTQRYRPDETRRLRRARDRRYLGRLWRRDGEHRQPARPLQGDGRAPGPLSSRELAKRANCAERYVREWLNSQVAGGYVAYHAISDSYELTPEQAFVLADEDSPVFIPTPGATRLDVGGRGQGR
jgi:hypothetical protein